MIAPTADTKTRILNSAYRLFYEGGFARVSMDAIADTTGVTKKTLYYHFPSKDALAASVLEHQNNLALGQIKKWGKKNSKCAADFLASMFKDIETWASQPNWMGSGFTRLTMELAHLPGHPAREAASRHKHAVEAWLAFKLEELGAEDPQDIARKVMLLIEGTMSSILIHRDPSYARSAASVAVCLAEVECA
ncbi:MAG TPA: TetR/AcrR family transcriptional regulator [Afifellaceae bacterium]|nr:TetR/AcrR family transcriptional regulator [Afifellaceae bacterium]